MTVAIEDLAINTEIQEAPAFSLAENGIWDVITADNRLSLLPNMSDSWMIDSGFVSTAINIIKSMSASEWQASIDTASDRAKKSADAQVTGYKILDGVAYIPMVGVMSKRPNCMAEMFGGGGASTLLTQMAIRAALENNDVKNIMMMIESPGGDVNGAFDLATSVASANLKKPVYAYISDIGASAAYLVASQARKIFANENAVIGSIGVYTVMEDSSKAATEQGIKVHVVKAGKFKAIGEPGTNITEEQLKYVQGKVNSLQSLFVKAVHKGRNMNAEALTKITDGSTYVGKQAIKVGLIDGVASLENIHQAIIGGKSNKGTKMASDIDEVIGWITPDTAQEDTALANANANHLTGSPIDVQILMASLNAHGVKDVASLENLIARAKIGDDFSMRMRDQTKKLAVIALGPEDGAMAAEMIDAMNINQIRAMAKQYETIGTSKGLIAAMPSPERKTSPQGLAVATETVNDKTPEGEKTVQEMAAANRIQMMNSGMYSL